MVETEGAAGIGAGSIPSPCWRPDGVPPRMDPVGCGLGKAGSGRGLVQALGELPREMTL